MTKEEIINESKKTAINAFKMFLRNINLDEQLFNHIYDIPIIIGRVIKDSSITEYDPEENFIVINEEDLQKYMDMINKGNVSETTVVINIAHNLVHEMIHANRTIQQEYIPEKEIDEYDNNEQNNNEIMEDVQDEPVIDLVSKFYNKSEKISPKKKELIKTQQTSLEEIVTEALALIIIKTRNNNTLDLEEVNKEIQKRETNIENKIGLQIITNIGIEGLQWFMTAAYDDIYDDRFSKIFQEEYNNLLMDVDFLYRKQNNNYYEKKYSIEDAERIIKEKTGKKR